MGKTPVHTLRQPWYRSLLKSLTGFSFAGSTHFFKRVVVAVRLKRDDRLFLKAFREVPVDRLDQILPAGYCASYCHFLACYTSVHLVGMCLTDLE